MKTRKLLAALLALSLVLALSAPALAADAELTYDGEEFAVIKADGTPFGMFTPQEGTTVTFRGEWYEIHLVPKNTTVYDGIYLGFIEDAHYRDVVANADGSFDIRVTVAPDQDAEAYMKAYNAGRLVPIAPIKAKDGGTTEEQYYLALPAGKLCAFDPVGYGDYGYAPNALTIENTTKMFKADKATLYTDRAWGPDGPGGEFAVSLEVTLSGSTYEYLYVGTYEQAAANGNRRANWIKGTKDADGRVRFFIPVMPGQTVVPVVSISSTYLAKYEAGENAIERAFYPRQFVIDLEAKTLTVGDYEKTQALSVDVHAKMFKVDAAVLETVGGPNSNNYSADLVLTMGSDSFDKAYVGRAKAAEKAADTVALSADRSFTLPVKYVAEFGKPETLVSKADDPFIVSFHSVKNDAWYERQFRLREDAAALDIYDGVKSVATTQNLTVDGVAREAEIYNIDGHNYFKLRDVAALLTGTDAQFSVDYDKDTRTILVATAQPYEAQTGDLVLGKDKSESTLPGTMSVQLDGAACSFENVYNIGGNNFFQLVELGEKLGFGVSYDSATRTMLVTTK